MGNDIDLNLYKVFYTVATVGNITKAAEELYISQPAVTKAIHTLETNLGGVLFIRTKKGVTLTEEGKVLLSYVKNILTEARNAENKFNSLIKLEEGKIRIGASATVSKHFLMPYIAEFHKMYPNIDIEIVSYALVTEFIKAWFGIGYITKEFAKQELETNEIYELKVTPKIESRELGIVTLKNSALNYAASKFVEIILKDINK